MNTNPQVAIMMPVYNVEKTLPLAIASLIHQTYPYWKCYIVNDGSTDGTKELLDNLKDPRFVIIHFDKNKGRPYARQAALDAAEGKYLAFLDADDFYHPEKLKLQVETFSKHEVSLVSCGNASFDAAKELKSVRGLGTLTLQRHKTGTTPIMAMRTSMVLMSTAKLIKFDPRLKYAQDTDYLSKYLSIEKSYIVQDKVLYYYSEFESVTGTKILKTRWYGLIRLTSLFKHAPFRVLLSTAILIFKWIATAILLPIVGAEFFLGKRGNQATPEMKMEFANVFKTLRS